MNGDKPLFTIESFVHKRASSTHTQPNQRQAMLEWLETQENFALLASPSAIKASSMEGARLKKTDGYRSLCEYVNRRTHNSDWTPMIAKSRFESFMKVYRRTIVEMKHPDFGLLPDDIKRGVDTIPKKLNDLCPCFDRIDVLAKKAAELELVEVRMDARSDPDPEVVHAIDQVVNEINMVANDSMSNDMIALVGSSSKGPSIKWINNGPPLRNSIVIPQTPSSSSSSTSSIAGQKRLRDDSVEITSPVSASNASTLPQVNASSPLSVATNHAGGAGSGSGSSVIARANLTNGAGLGSGGSSMSRSGVNGALNGGSPSARTNVTTGSVINILSVAGLGGSTNGGGVGGSGILGNGQGGTSSSPESPPHHSGVFNLSGSSGGIGGGGGLGEPKSKMPKIQPPSFVTPERFGLIKDPKSGSLSGSSMLNMAPDPKLSREAQMKELEIKWQEIELKRRECEVREREVELRKMELEYESNMKMKRMKADILLTLLGEGKTDEQIAKYFELFN